MVKCQQNWAFLDIHCAIIIATSTAAEGAGHQPSIVCANYWRDKAKEENKKDHQGTLSLINLINLCLVENICLHIV